MADTSTFEIPAQDLINELIGQRNEAQSEAAKARAGVAALTRRVRELEVALAQATEQPDELAERFDAEHGAGTAALDGDGPST